MALTWADSAPRTLSPEQQAVARVTSVIASRYAQAARYINAPETHFILSLAEDLVKHFPGLIEPQS